MTTCEKARSRNRASLTQIYVNWKHLWTSIISQKILLGRWKANMLPPCHQKNLRLDWHYNIIFVLECISFGQKEFALLNLTHIHWLICYLKCQYIHLHLYIIFVHHICTSYLCISFCYLEYVDFLHRIVFLKILVL